MCALFLLWRRASALKSVISYRLKTWREPEGRIRLSEDDGPPAREFLEDEYDEDVEGVDDEDDEPLTERVKKATAGAGLRVDTSRVIQLPVRPVQGN